MGINEIDYQWFQRINGWGGSVSALNPLMSFLAQNAEYVFLAGIIVYWFSRRALNRRMVVEALMSACIALGVSGLIGAFFYRDRPFVNHHVLQLIVHPANASFPSDHATGAFVIATVFWLFRKKGAALWIVLAGCIAFSRIWTGVHYPTDVIAGAVLGVVTAIGIHQLTQQSTRVQKFVSFCITSYELFEMKLWPRVRQ